MPDRISNVYFSRWSDGVFFDTSRSLNFGGNTSSAISAINRSTDQYNNATLQTNGQNAQTVYFGYNGYVILNSSYLTNHNVNLEWWVKYDIGGDWFKFNATWFYVEGSSNFNFRAKCYMRDWTHKIVMWSNETHAIYNGPPPPPPGPICPSAFRGQSIVQIGEVPVNPCSSTLREEDSQGHMNAISGFIKHKLEPFAPSMIIKFGVGQNSNATMKVFSGTTEIRTLFGEFFSKGKYATYWDGKNEAGQMMPDGEYTFKLQIGNQEFTKNWKFVSLAGIEFPIQNPDILSSLQKRTILRLMKPNLSNMVHKFRWKATDPYVPGNDLADVTDEDDEASLDEGGSDILANMTFNSNATNSNGGTATEPEKATDPSKIDSSTVVTEAKDHQVDDTDKSDSTNSKDPRDVISTEDKLTIIPAHKANSQIETLVIPKQYQLHANYPNPFNPTTTIRFDLPESSVLTLTIYNMNGQKVKELANGSYSAGIHNVSWDSKDSFGRTVPSGVYIYRLQSDKITLSKKMTLVK